MAVADIPGQHAPYQIVLQSGLVRDLEGVEEKAPAPTEDRTLLKDHHLGEGYTMKYSNNFDKYYNKFNIHPERQDQEKRQNDSASYPVGHTLITIEIVLHKNDNKTLMIMIMMTKMMIIITSSKFHSDIFKTTINKNILYK